MTYEEVLNIIKNERECVKRQNGGFCDNQRDCKNCDLVIPNECVIEAYDITIEAIKKQIQRAKALKAHDNYPNDDTILSLCKAIEILTSGIYIELGEKSADEIAHILYGIKKSIKGA